MYILARYPFLDEAKKYIKENNLDMDTLLQSPLYDNARIRGFQKVRNTIEYGELKTGNVSTQSEQIMELLSHIVSRILVSCINDEYLINRYAIAESKRVYRELQTEKIDFVDNIAVNLGMNTKIDSQNQMLKIHFVDYLVYSTGIKNKAWRLCVRELSSGYVRISKRECARLIQEAITKKIMDTLPLPVNESMKNVFIKEIKELTDMMATKKRRYTPEKFGKIDTSIFPPCMKQLLGGIHAGENIPHQGRFALTTFLYAVGMNEKEIMSLFSQLPDFDAHKSVYQIEHITGKISKTTYTPPKCSTMRTYGLCVNKDYECEKISHPVAYYRTKKKKGKFTKI